MNSGYEDEFNRPIDEQIMRDAAKLATEITPQRDLWPDIEAAIKAPQRSSWTPFFAQAAAVLLLVGASSGVTYMLTKGDVETSVSPVAQNIGLNANRVSYVGDHTFGSRFQDDRANLVADLDVELDRLSPDTRADVEANLDIIRTAIDDIHKALEQEPNNAHLQEMLLNTYREELAVMRNIGGLTKNVMSRNDI